MSVSFAQDRKVDINALVQETQKMSDRSGEMTLIWWIPEEFWRASFEQDPNMTAAQTEEFIKVLRPYMLIVAVDGNIGSFGGVTYKSETTIRGSIQVIDSQGTRYRPLNNENIDANTKNFLSMMKPVFVNMLGPIGQNMHFFLFPAKNTMGQNIAVAKSEGAFSVKLDQRVFKWRLPLGSLLPVKICPVDGEKLSVRAKLMKRCSHWSVTLIIIPILHSGKKSISGRPGQDIAAVSMKRQMRKKGWMNLYLPWKLVYFPLLMKMIMMKTTRYYRMLSRLAPTKWRTWNRFCRLGRKFWVKVEPKAGLRFYFWKRFTDWKESRGYQD